MTVSGVVRQRSEIERTLSDVFYGISIDDETLNGAGEARLDVGLLGNGRVILIGAKSKSLVYCCK